MTTPFKPTVFKKWKPSHAEEFTRFYAADMVEKKALEIIRETTTFYSPDLPSISATVVGNVVQDPKETCSTSMNVDSTELEFYQAMQESALKLLEYSTMNLHNFMKDNYED